MPSAARLRSCPRWRSAIAYLGSASLLWQTERRAKRQVRAAFGKFVSPAVVAKIAERPELLVLSGETRELSILFSDLRNFSTISESLDAHEVASFLNGYLTPMTDVILALEGTVDKYIGDAIVAFWNAPLDIADHTRRAAEASLAMRNGARGLQPATGRAARAPSRRRCRTSAWASASMSGHAASATWARCSASTIRRWATR